MLRIPLVMLVAFVSIAPAQYCGLLGAGIFAQDSKNTFLGIISQSPYETESIMNPYGDYGSEYSSTSIFNTYSDFGSKYSDYSPANEYSNKPPLIITVDQNGEPILLALLSRNKYATTPRDWLGTAPIVNPDALIPFLQTAKCGPVALGKSLKRKAALTAKPPGHFGVDLLGRRLSPVTPPTP